MSQSVFADFVEKDEVDCVAYLEHLKRGGKSEDFHPELPDWLFDDDEDAGKK